MLTQIDLTSVYCCCKHVSVNAYAVLPQPVDYFYAAAAGCMKSYIVLVPVTVLIAQMLKVYQLTRISSCFACEAVKVAALRYLPS
jgi:hypothetical protein